MPRLSRADASRCLALESELATLVDGGPPTLSWIVPALRGVLGTDKIAGVTFRQRGEGLSAPGYSDGLSPAFLPFADNWLADKKVDWTFVNMTRPPAEERNVVRMGGEVAERSGKKTAPIVYVYEKFRLPIDTHARALVCEGSSLLAWIGIWQDAPIESRQRLLFARLVKPIQRRLAAERTLADGPMLRAALDVAFEAIPAPAFILLEDGTIDEANRVGREWLARDRGARIKELRDCVRGGRAGDDRGGYRVTRLVAPGAPGRYFVLHQGDAVTGRACAMAGAHWGFTTRESQVLALLADGLTNRAIAAELGVSERGVEARLTAMFAKAQVETRAELVVRALRRT